MPLPLDDNRWHTLKTAYKLPATDVVEWLDTAYRSGMTDELLGDIINDVQHQGDSSEPPQLPKWVDDEADRRFDRLESNPELGITEGQMWRIVDDAR